MSFDDHDRADFLRNTVQRGACRVLIDYHQRKHGRQYVEFHGGLRNAVEVAYTLFVGDLPPNTRPHHRCKTPNCVEGSHLFAARLRVETKIGEDTHVS